MEHEELKSRIETLAGTFGLSEILNRPVSAYSGGQRRRLEITRALVCRPSVLFLDEPTVGLDPRIRYELLDLIAGLRSTGELTILLTTHYLDEAERLCDRIAILHEGKIVALDSPAALLASLGAEMVELRVEGVAAETALIALKKNGIAGEDSISFGSSITMPLHHRSGHETLAAIAALELPTSGVSARRTTLDDVYLRLTGGRIAA